MADIFREVDEDVRKERYVKLWRTYGRYAIGLAVVVVISVVGMSGWQQYERASNEAESERFANAVSMADSGNYVGAIEGFSRLGSEATSGYRGLSRLQEAAALLESGDYAAAIAIYDNISADSSIRKELRELSRLFAVMNISDTPDFVASPGGVAARLEDLGAEHGPWRFSARELEALVKLQNNDRSGALEDLAALRDDIHAPPALRARSSELYGAVEDHTN